MGNEERNGAGHLRAGTSMKRRVILMGAGALCAGAPRWLLAQAQGMDQVALSIGNNNYRDAAQLVNAARDARLIHETFSKLGVRSELCSNLDSAALNHSIADFVRKMQGREIGVAWFFFSGHGAALEGKSLLLGTDASLQSP